MFLGYYLLVILLVNLLKFLFPLLLELSRFSSLLMARRSHAVNTRAVIKGAPWNIVFFSIGMYVVVYGLGNAGLTYVLARCYSSSCRTRIICCNDSMGFIAAFLSSIMNNMPTVMIDALLLLKQIHLVLFEKHLFMLMLLVLT